jgi:hypothetical protein
VAFFDRTNHGPENYAMQPRAKLFVFAIKLKISQVLSDIIIIMVADM